MFSRIANRSFAAAVLCATLAGNCMAQAAAAAKTPEQQDAENIADLVIANHILADQGVVDGFGHVSVRSVKNPSHFFIARSRAPALVTADDILEYDLDDHDFDTRGRKSYLERFIHAEVYRARPDVNAVVHSHSPSVIPFSISTVPLRPVVHTAGFLVRAVPVFEIREAGGDQTNMLISTPALGAALAKKLGPATVVLMRGHGDTVVGQTLKTAVLHAIYAEFNARVQSAAVQLGGPITYLNEAEAEKTAIENDSLVERPWEIWKLHAEERGAAR